MNTLTILLLFAFAGYSFAKAIPRIVGGSHASDSEFPWQGNLQILSGPAWYNLCGCVLYSYNKALTAAHCLSSGSASYRVVFGVTDVTSEHGTWQESRLNSVSIHPNYQNNPGAGYPNDIAVLRLTTAMDTSGPAVKPITMASENGISEFDGQSCVITGWGSEGEGSDKSDILKKVNMTVLTAADCVSLWNDFGLPISEGQMCAFNNGTNACHGDNGGAMVCGNTLAGITSWGLTSCDGTHPTVFSRVSYYYDWVQAQ